MRAHVGSAVIQEYGCRALVNVSASGQHKIQVAKAGGIEAVVASLRAHVDSVDVVEYGCSALATISYAGISCCDFRFRGLSRSFCAGDHIQPQRRQHLRPA
eukprot:TRINITY_DN10428_c0_g1_i1.p1 TRINITY_DN10428_c0_g1~~TRINITY_DN10428_c0_g1_i1.p1  ORF type:complete len:117 (-),score=5.43 TRINITY_DN10428_c0_g1_i1:415-717(-)